MTAVEQAAEMIAFRLNHTMLAPFAGQRYSPNSLALAKELDEAGLLRPEWATDEAKAVLDAACDLINKDRYGLPGDFGRALMDLTHKVDTLAASRQVTT